MSRNLGIPGLVTKLHFLGVPGLTHALGGRPRMALQPSCCSGSPGPRDVVPTIASAEARVWLALLTLGAFRSPLAPPYVTLSMLWLLTVLAGEIRGRRSWVVAFVVAWIVIMGPPPLHGATEFTVAFLGQLAGLAVCIWALRGPRPGSPARRLPRSRPADGHTGAAPLPRSLRGGTSGSGGTEASGTQETTACSAALQT